MFTKKNPAFKHVCTAFTMLPAELLKIRVIQKNSKLSYSSIMRFLINEGMAILMPMTSREVVRHVLQNEAEREVKEKNEIKTKN